VSQKAVHISVSPDLSSIVQAGILAPSADNRHCFELQASPDCILLFGSKAYLSAPYHRQVLSLISFGAVAENMTIRARRLGYRTNVSWLPDAAQPSLIARLRLTKAEAVESALDAAISGRHTNRRLLFSGPRLSEAELAHFGQLLHDIDGVSLAFFDSGRQRTQLLRLIRIAETERFNTRALHEDLFSSVRFDVGWQTSAAEGLPPSALGVEQGFRWAFAQLRRWPLMNALRRIGFHHALGFRAGYLPCRFAPYRGVLTTSLPIERGAISVGVALQRIWLEGERRGLAFQPFAGAALLALPKYNDVPVATGERLRQGWSALTDETPVMVFRLGHAARPAIRTGRQAPESYLRF
jgi:hypothetical protein